MVAMSSLVSTTEMSNTANMFNSIFDTWSRNIIIYKEPIKQQILPQNPNSLFGFGVTQSTELFNYIPVTGIYPALVRYNDRYASKSKQDEFQSELNKYVTEGPLSIKVRVDCMNFIVEGKTEKIQVDGFDYILDGIDPRVHYFWGNEFYIFDLERKL